MNSENSIRKIDTDISDTNVILGGTVLYLLPFIALFSYKAIDKITNFAHDTMEHGYDIKITAGPVDIKLTKNNL